MDTLRGLGSLVPGPSVHQSVQLRGSAAPMARREEQQQPVFAAIDALEFPELHDESIPYMAFIRNCARLLAAAGVRDFNMQVCCPVTLLGLCTMHGGHTSSGLADSRLMASL